MKLIQIGGYRNNTVAISAKIDDEDFDSQNQFRWSLNGQGYVHRNLYVKGKQFYVSLHASIMKTPKGFVTDHINGDKLDNQRSNLRVCTHSVNMHNRKLDRNNTSGFTGVSLYRSKWRAYIGIQGKRKHLGIFSSKEEAAAAYKEAKNTVNAPLPRKRGRPKADIKV